MAVITLVHRALPFSLPWKRRPSTSNSYIKGKEKEIEIQTPDSGYASQNDPQADYHNAEIPDTRLRCDVPHALHIAVKQHSVPTSDTLAHGDESVAGYASYSTETDSLSDCKTHQLAEKCEPSARPQLPRVVSWASIVRSQCRWTSAQEKKLQDARRQLARCQKAWSSEQELWLAHVQALSEEKEAHSDFMLQRKRQQNEEQHQFRKAWKRRRSFETTLQLNSLEMKSNTGVSNKFRRLHRHGYLTATPVVATGSTALECRG